MVSAVVSSQPYGELHFSTAFQPVFSLTHARLVGHEALLRIHDEEGRSLPPGPFLTDLPGSFQAQIDLEAAQQHLQNYSAQSKARAAEWLFLNLHPASLLSARHRQELLAGLQLSGINPSALVIEVLESPMLEHERVHDALSEFRQAGCLLAVDDFGAGHSNFERVFDIAPDLVKLDRAVLLRAKASPRARRILQRTISLLHECGALVLMEGVETELGAHIAMTCDADLVQGYFFGKPMAAALEQAHGCQALEQAWATFDVKQSREEDRWRQTVADDLGSLLRVAGQVEHGAAFRDAAQQFLAIPNALMCYLLDEHGRQVADVSFRDVATQAQLSRRAQFAPLHDAEGARWSRRQYFRRAVAFPGSVQITRPYMTIQGACMCLTASLAFHVDGKLMVVCGDLKLRPDGEYL